MLVVGLFCCLLFVWLASSKTLSAASSLLVAVVVLVLVAWWPAAALEEDFSVSSILLACPLSSAVHSGLNGRGLFPSFVAAADAASSSSRVLLPSVCSGSVFLFWWLSLSLSLSRVLFLFGSVLSLRCVFSHVVVVVLSSSTAGSVGGGSGSGSRTGQE